MRIVLEIRPDWLQFFDMFIYTNGFTIIVGTIPTSMMRFVEKLVRSGSGIMASLRFRLKRRVV